MFAKAAVAIAATLVYSSIVMGQDGCQCYHRMEGNVDYTVCSDRSLTSIPDCVPSNTAHLAISTPTIPLVPETLQRFTSLIQLIVSDFNDVVEISTDFLLYQRSLVTFDLRNMSIDYVDKRWFTYAPNLQGVGMVNNKIASVAEDTYSSLPMVNYIRLEGNQLTTLPATLFEGTSLKYFHFADNPWHCDCELMKVMRWLWDHSVIFMDQPLCWEPSDLRGMKLQDLTEGLVCA